jgi:hypothetical protein
MTRVTLYAIHASCQDPVRARWVGGCGGSPCGKFVQGGEGCGRCRLQAWRRAVRRLSLVVEKRLESINGLGQILSAKADAKMVAEVTVRGAWKEQHAGGIH